MDRKALYYIRQWYLKRGRKPLIVRGARQVGKSYLVREFARRESLSLLEINFEKEPEAADLFQKRSLQKTCELLELQYKKKIDPQKTVLFLDELQAAPSLIPMLRYFYEEMPELPVIAAGSLLEFVLKDHTFSMPVGRVEYLHLGPMTFDEFLMAHNESDLLKYLHQFDLSESIPHPIHQRLLDHVRTFSIVGGMPASIEALLQSSWEECQAVKQNILSTYEDDFSKYRNRIPDVRLRKIFRKIPRLVGEKIKYVNIDPQERSKNLSQAVDLLCMAGVGHRVFHSSANGIPLGAEINEKFFKLLFLDVGLMSTATGLSLLDLERKNDLNVVNQGKLTEQWVGQHLLFDNPPYQPPELYYWVREKRNSSAEIDYIVSQGAQLIPIEVKSGGTGRLRSLHLFLKEKKSPVGLRFNAEPPSLFKDQNSTLISLPFYLVGEWRRLISREVA